MKRIVAKVLLVCLVVYLSIETILGNVGFEYNRHIFVNAYSGISRVKDISFADLRVVTENGHGCDVPVHEIYESDCFWQSTPTNIPKTFIYLSRFLRIGSKQTNLIGIILSLLVIASSTYVSQKILGLFGGTIMAGFFLASHPTRYALERGNIDLIVYLIILLICACSARLMKLGPKPGQNQSISDQTSGFFRLNQYLPKYVLEFLGTLLLAFGIAGKVYPILLFPLLILVFMIISRQDPKVLASEGSFILFRGFCFSKFQLLCLILILTSFGLIVGDVPHMLQSSASSASGGLSYGFKTLPEPGQPIALQYIIKFCVIIIGFAISSSTKSWRKIKSSNKYKLDSSFNNISAMGEALLMNGSYWDIFSVLMFLSGSMIFSGSYIFFNNGNYRLVLLIGLLAPFLVRVLGATLMPAQWPVNSVSDSAGKSAIQTDVLFFLFLILVVCLFNYRPYIPGLQHITNIFWGFLVLPLLSGFASAITLETIYRAFNRERLSCY